VKFLEPVYPPALGPNPEELYSQMTAQIRDRVVEAYEELRGTSKHGESPVAVGTHTT
jgi:hypothetical protein